MMFLCKQWQHSNLVFYCSCNFACNLKNISMKRVDCKRVDCHHRQKKATKEKKAFDNSKNGFNFDPWQCAEQLNKEEFDSISQSKFASIIDKCIAHEGEYANDPEDRGGETKFGITKIFMEEYKEALPGREIIPIKELTIEDAKRLYKAMWERYNLGYIKNKNLAYVLFDYMINSYAGTVAKRVQRILNTRGASLKIDGHIGEKSLEAIENCDPQWLADEILKNRQQSYRNIVETSPAQGKFYSGWINRLNRIAKEAGSSLRFSPHSATA